MSTMGPEAFELSSQESVNGDIKSSSSLSHSPSGKEPLHAHHPSAAREALTHSADASRFLAESDYNAALNSYQRALYLYQAQNSAVGQCNAAATLHNMALLHKTCERYDAAVQCFQEAEDLYRECASHVNATTVLELQQGHVCLDHLLVETLHNRAFVHSKYQHDITMAISCHEQVVETILSTEDDAEKREQPASGGVIYVKMNNAQRVAFLAESLKNLGVFYSIRGETEGALGALEEGLEVLKCQVAECPDDVAAKKSMATVLINLGSVYFGQEQFSKALEALQHAMDLWMDVEEDPASSDVLATVNNMGLAHERMGNLEKALECYEDFLHIKSQVLGNDHVEVADSLTTVAKVLERQGNGEGALDLYQEALRIYKVAAENEDPSLWSSAGDVLGRIGTILLEMDQVDESIENFQEALQMEHRTLGETSEETASIYHGLGRAYMAKCRYDEARECLLKAARMLEAVPNDGVHLDSLVESSEKLKQALNNESFLSSDGTWVNAEINIEKTPERMALGTSMSPIGESSLSADPESTEDESPSENFSLSSASSRILSSSHLSQLQVFVHPGPPEDDSSIEIEVSPITTCYKTPTEASARREFDPDLSPVISQDSPSPSSDTQNSDAVDTHQASVLDAVDMNRALKFSGSGQGQEISLKAGPSDEVGQDQQQDCLEENPEEPWASALALARVASAEHESFHIEDSDQVDVSGLATPNSTMAGIMVQDTFQVESEDETGEDTEQEELQRGLMMEFSEFESQSDLGANTADYASASDNEFESQSDLGTNTADYASASDNEFESQSDLGTNTVDSASASDTETDDYTNSSFEDRTEEYAVNYSSDLDTADYAAKNTSSDLDTATHQLPSVAEGFLSHSFNSTSSVGMSRTRTQETPTEESAHEESDFLPSAVETDADSNGAIMAGVYRYGEAANPANDSNTAMSENDVESHYTESEHESATVKDSLYSDSEHDDASAYSVSEPERDYENGYRQLSIDNEESDIFGTDLDTDIDSASIEKPQFSILCDSEGPQPCRGAHREPAQREAPARFAQLNVEPRGMEGMVQQLARNDANAHTEGAPSRSAAEGSHHWHSNEMQREDSTDNDTFEPLLAPSVTSEKKLHSPRDSTGKMSSPRGMLAKAFKHPFRRRKSSGMIPLESMPEDKEHEPPHVARPHRSPTSQDGVRVAPSFDPAQSTAPIRPIQYIDLQSSSFDDNVSQITFLGDETSVRRRSNSNGSWWWGAPSEGEGWLPAVVGAAEEFLSARTIHDQIKSSKREASSSSTDEESDIFGNLSVEGDEGEVEEVMNEQLDPTFDDIGADVVVVNVAVENGTSPVVSETKRSEIPVSNPSPASNPSIPSNNSGAGRRRGSSRSRPKMQDLQKTLESQRNRLGSKHPDVAETLTIMATIKSQEGEKEASLELLHEALQIRKSIGDKAAFARTLHKLGDVYTQQKEYPSSLSCHADALNLERLVHGYQHPEIAKSLNKIGSVYARQGDFGVALSNHQHALQILKDCVGEDLSHPLVAQTLICIGAVYYKERNSLETIRAKSDGYNTFIDSGMLDVIARAHEQRGSYRMAIAFFEEKLQLLRNRDKRGMNKQEVAEALARLGTLSREAGLYLEALDYYDETENIQTAMGRNQVEIARGRLMKGTVLYHLGQYKGSLRLFKEAQTILQATVGSDQQLLIGETFQWIGKVQTELCDYGSALKALKTALEIQTVALGSDHPTTLKSRLAIASVLLHKAKMDASINLLTAILETQGRIHGPKHPNLAETMFYIGKAYKMKGDIVSAMKFFEESFFMAEKFLGHDHPSQASTLHCIADLQKAKRRYKKSLQLLTSVLNMRRDTLGDGHISVAMTLCSIAACHAATGRFAESTKYIDEALPIAERAVGAMHPAVGLILVTHGNLYLRKCQFEQAREMTERGLEVYVACNVAKKHPYRLEAEETLERVERDEALCV